MAGNITVIKIVFTDNFNDIEILSNPKFIKCVYIFAKIVC